MTVLLDKKKKKPSLLAQAKADLSNISRRRNEIDGDILATNMEEDGGSMGMLNSMTSEAWGFFLDGNCGKLE